MTNDLGDLKPTEVQPLLAGTKASTDSKSHPSDGLSMLGTLLLHLGLGQASEFARRGQRERAHDLLSDLIKEHPNSPAILDLQARVSAQQGDLNSARELWELALQADPKNDEYRLSLERITNIENSPFRGRSLPWKSITGSVAVILILFLLWAQVNRLQRVESLAAEVSALIQADSKNVIGLAKIEDLAINMSSDIVAVSDRLTTVQESIHVLETDLDAAMSPEAVQVEQVRNELLSDSELKTSNLSVWQVGSVIYLGGAVASRELKLRAQELARSVVIDVIVDSSGMAIVPNDLGGSVRSAIQSNPILGEVDISVDQIGSDIRLWGTVATLEEKNEAERVAGQVPGVSLVDSRMLQIGQPDLTRLARNAIQSAPRLAEMSIHITRSGDNLILTGCVTAPRDKERADQLVRQVSGVDLVDSGKLSVGPCTPSEQNPASGQRLNDIPNDR